MHPPVAAPAVQEHSPKLALELGLRLEEFHPEALGCRDQTGLVFRIDSMSFLNEAVGVVCSVGDGADGSLEDLTTIRPGP
jgi:hypothetical protein